MSEFKNLDVDAETISPGCACKIENFFSPAISFWLEQFEPLIGFSVFC